MSKRHPAPFERRGNEYRIASMRLQMVRRELGDWQKWRCFYCTRNLDSYTITFDHIKLASDGGDVSIENGVGACRACNQLRGDMPFDEFCIDQGISCSKAARVRYLCELANGIG